LAVLLLHTLSARVLRRVARACAVAVLFAVAAVHAQGVDVPPAVPEASLPPSRLAVNRCGAPIAVDDTMQRISLQCMTLIDAVGLALVRHPDIGRANAVVLQGESEVAVAKAAWYPRIDYGLLPGYGGSYGTDGNATGTRTTLGVSQLLYDFGRTSSRISAADATLRQRRHLLADTVENVAWDVANTFIELAASQDVISAAQRQVDSLRRLQRRIVERVGAGLSVASDGNLAEMALLRAEAEEIKALSRFDLAVTRFAELTGVRPSGVAGLEATRLLLREMMRESVDNIEQTPTILAAVAALDAADAKLRQTEAERFPSIAIGANRARSTGPANAANNTWVGLALNGAIAVGDLAARNQIAAARAERRAAAETLESQRQMTRAALAGALEEFESVRARLSSYDKLISLTRLSRGLYWQEYMLNKRLLTDVVAPDRELFQAESEWTAAVADGARAAIRARVVTGNFVLWLQEYQAAEEARTGKGRLEAPRRSPNSAADRKDDLGGAMPTPDEAIAMAPPAALASASRGKDESDVLHALLFWAQAWSRKDVEAYLAAYDKDFAAPGGDRAAWEEARRQRLGKPGPIGVKVVSPQLTLAEDGVIVRFWQRYRSSNYSDTTFKMLEFVRRGEQWQIRREQTETRERP